MNIAGYRFAASVVFFLASLLSLSHARHTLKMHQNTISPESPSSNVCLTPGCIKAADTILSSLDETVDPCDDMYQFACGGWMSQRTIPEDRTEMDVSGVIADDLNLKLKELLEKEFDTPQPPFITMAKDLYYSCMDLNNIENMRSQPLKRMLDQLGGWPVVEGSRWEESQFDWVDTLISMRNLGYDHGILMQMQVDADARNNTGRVILLDQTSLKLPDRSFYLHGLNDSTVAAYFKMMVQSAKLLGVEESTAERELLEALNFETSLANISKPWEERRDQSKLYNRYSVGELQDFAPQIPWLKYFNGLLKNEIFENETVIVNVPDFVQKFANLISSTEKRVIANYMMWRVVSLSMGYLSKEWKDIAHEYSSTLSGDIKESPQWDKCLSTTMSAMGVALSSYYVRNYFNEEDREARVTQMQGWCPQNVLRMRLTSLGGSALREHIAALTIQKYIHKELLNILDDIDWMDETTKKEAKAKAIAIASYIGYPRELLNDTAVMDYYEGLKITNKSYFDNVMAFRKWRTDGIFSQLRKPTIKGEWDKYAIAAEVNAFYNPEENTIYFPAGILQDVFFERDRPNYLNFGGIGWVIGHEITHGFDDFGRQYDKDGNERNWWQQSTDEQFTRKAQCIIDQYSNYTVENGMNINGLLTQGENIADIGGLKEAYRAYQSWTKDNGPEQMLPGLEYTQNQLFWISAAYQWCTKYRPEVLKLYIVTDSHSLAQFRVIGSVSNLAEFAEDFNCPPDSPMNKRNKCEVW